MLTLLLKLLHLQLTFSPVLGGPTYLCRKGRSLLGGAGGNRFPSLLVAGRRFAARSAGSAWGCIVGFRNGFPKPERPTIAQPKLGPLPPSLFLPLPLPLCPSLSLALAPAPGYFGITLGSFLIHHQSSGSASSFFPRSSLCRQTSTPRQGPDALGPHAHGRPFFLNQNGRLRGFTTWQQARDMQAGHIIGARSRLRIRQASLGMPLPGHTIFALSSACPTLGYLVPSYP